MLHDAIILWLKDVIPHDNPIFAYLILLLLDDHSDQSEGTVDPNLRVEVESLIKSVSFAAIPLPSLLGYLTENTQSVIILSVSSHSLILHLALQP